MVDYTGEEKALDLTVMDSIEPDSVFDLRPLAIPANVVPIFDGELWAVIGYRHEYPAGVYRFYNLEGKIVGMEEKGLEDPLIDPLDLLLFAGGIFRAIGKGVVTALAEQPLKLRHLQPQGYPRKSLPYQCWAQCARHSKDSL